MAYPANSEQYVQRWDASAVVNEAAEAHGISLEPARLQQLVGAAQYLKDLEDMGISGGFTDVLNDVSVGRSEYVDRFGSTAATIDFAPVVEGHGDLVSGFISAHPEYATRFTLMAIHGLQNYALLVDAGIVEKPAILYRDTNPEMAIMAERMGLQSDAARKHPDDPETAHKEMRQVGKLEVSGSFDEVSNRVFSEDTKRLERVLVRRLAGQRQMAEAVLPT